MLLTYKFCKMVFRYLLPEGLRYPIGRFIARIVIFFNLRRRAIIENNLLPLVGPSEARRLTPVVLGNFVMTAIDFFCTRRNLARALQFENAQFLDKSYRRHKKIILVTAHIGNWELGMSWLVEQGYSVAGVYAPYRNDEIVEWILDHRHPDVEWIPAVRGAAEACIHALQRGRVLGMVADIPFGEKGHRVNIAGRRARLPLGPWAIAVRAQAVVIPAFILRVRPGVYRGIFHDPILPSAGTFRKQMETMQEAFRGHLEHYLKTTPAQWGVLQPFWEHSENPLIARDVP